MSTQSPSPSLFHYISVSVALRVTAVSLIILALTATYCQLQVIRSEFISDTEKQIARLDMVFAEQTGRAVEVIDLLVRGAAETLQANQLSIDVLAALLRHRIQDVRQLGAIIIFDVDGRQTLSSDPGRSAISAKVVDALLAHYQVGQHFGLTISQPFRTSDDRWSALLARPLYAPDGALSGIATGSVNLSYFEDFYRAVELNENGAIALHLRDGTLLARFPHVDNAIGSSFSNLPPFTDVLSHSQAGTLLMQSTVDGNMRIVAIRALRAFPLAVMVSVEEGRILAAVPHDTSVLICVRLLLVGAVVILLLSLSYRSRQVERLLDGSRVAHNMAEQARDNLLQQISERERAEGALRQAQRIEAIGQLTGGVAHDFNNLLTVVLGNVEILQRRAATLGNDLLEDRLLVIRAAAERGATLTGHLLAFARRLPLMPKAVDLNATICGMQKLLDTAVGTRAITQLRLAEDLWPAMVDQSQIELVILNLVINARDAMPNGGIITIETANKQKIHAVAMGGESSGDFVTITIRDAGVGIPPEILARVFEPFFTTKALGAGSGLGLSQVFGTAKQSGGEVYIQSDVGRGTAVMVDLPRAVVVLPPRGTGIEGVNLRGSKALILLVDDDDPVRTSTEVMLQDLGYQVLDANGGAAALTVLNQTKGIDILLTDVVMPVMNGSQLAKAARAIHPDLPVVFLSGYADQIGNTLASGDQVIPKPFTLVDLHHAIELVLAGRRGVMS